MSDQPWNQSDEWEESDDMAVPIALVRSRRIRLRFDVRQLQNADGASKLVTYFRDRRLAQRRVTPEELQEIRGSTAWSEPVPLVGLARYAEGGDTLLLSLRAEAASRFGPFDSDEAYIWLGYRYRPRGRQVFPGDLDRETRDLFGSLLQGRPDAAIGRLFEESRREADWRYEARMRSGGHPPGRDIAEGLQRSRIRKGGNR